MDIESHNLVSTAIEKLSGTVGTQSWHAHELMQESDAKVDIDSGFKIFLEFQSALESMGSDKRWPLVTIGCEDSTIKEIDFDGISKLLVSNLSFYLIEGSKLFDPRDEQAVIEVCNKEGIVCLFRSWRNRAAQANDWEYSNAIYYVDRADLENTTKD